MAGLISSHTVRNSTLGKPQVKQSGRQHLPVAEAMPQLWSGSPGTPTALYCSWGWKQLVQLPSSFGFMANLSYKLRTMLAGQAEIFEQEEKLNHAQFIAFLSLPLSLWLVKEGAPGWWDISQLVSANMGCWSCLKPGHACGGTFRWNALNKTVFSSKGEKLQAQAATK